MDATNLKVFLTEAVRTSAATGAVLPSSRAMARAVVHPLTEPRGRPVRVLEVGPGTGVCTRELLARLGAQDHLDVVEVNPRFAANVRSLVAATGGPDVPTVRVQECLVQEAELTGPYDAVVCGLPFTNFPPAVVREITDQLLGVLAPGAVLGYFAYIGTLRLRRVVGSRAQVRRHAEVEAIMDEHHRRRGLRPRTVLANVPPARVKFLLG